jgi:hypothetical protein
MLVQGETGLSKRMASVVFLTLILFALSATKLDMMSALVSDAALTGTNVSGAITTNTTWTLSGSPYRVTADVLVLVDVFLTVEPGVTVKFDNGTSIVVDGKIIIQGDSAHITTFTSNAPSPAAGDWGNIRTRTGGRIVSVMWTTIEYSSGGIEFPVDSSGIILDCVFRENGVGISGSNVSITRCTFYKNTDGINAANVRVVDCEFFNNTNGIVGSGTVQNTNVWNSSGNGISFPSSGSVSNCSIHDNGGDGVVCQGSIVDCVVYNNSGVGAGGGENGHISNCSVFNNGIGIVGGTLFNCSVYHNRGDGVTGNQYVTGDIINCSINYNGGNGAYVYKKTVANSSFFNNKGCGVRVHLGLLSRCNVYNNLGEGVVVIGGDGGPIYVQDTQIYGNLVGIKITHSGCGEFCDIVPAYVSNCTIKNNSEGGIVLNELAYPLPRVKLWVSNTIIDSNGMVGIDLNTNVESQRLIAEISECAITNHTYGAVGSFGRVTSSNITGNMQIGLEARRVDTGYWGFPGIVTEIIGNNIHDNGIYNIKNHLPFGQDLNATMNWWGTTNTTEIGAFIYDYYEDYNLSRVLFEPILTSPIPEFPSPIILSLFMIASLLTAALLRRKNMGWSRLQKQ